jgi:adenylate cyclase
MQLNPDDARAATIRSVALCRTGHTEEGVRWAERALLIDPEDAGIRYNVACLYSVEGMVDQAIECLSEAVRKGFGHPEWLARDPDMDPLRDDPRFRRLVAAMERGES